MKTYQSIMAKIAALQEEAETLKAAERAGVIARIQEAMKVYAITAEELQASATPVSKRGGNPPGPTGRKRISAAAKAAHKRIKYMDPNGNKWSGMGKAPKWLLDHEAAGASRDEFLYPPVPRR